MIALLVFEALPRGGGRPLSISSNREKITASGEETEGGEISLLVETGESRTPRPEKAHPRCTTGLVGSLFSFGCPLPTEGNQTSRLFLE